MAVYVQVANPLFHLQEVCMQLPADCVALGSPSDLDLHIHACKMIKLSENPAFISLLFLLFL